MRIRTGLLIACVAHAGLALAQPSPTAGQAWSPQRNVEIVVSSVPGGSNDKTARTVERILTAHRIVNVPMTVMNKAGGGSSIAFTYTNAHPGDGHFLMVGTPGLLSGHIMGTNKQNYLDFSPIASLFNDYVVFAVNANSPIKSGRDLVERLRKNPQGVIAGLTNVGSHNHVAIGLVMKATGANVRELKTVVFKGSAESVTAALGGHIDLVTTAGANAHPHVASGRMRVIAVSAPQRFGGALADAPTWREQGVDVVAGGWRAIVGPRGLSAAQIEYWENALRRATETPEWKADLEKNYWTDDFVTSARFRKDLEKDYADMKAVLTEIGLAR